MIDVTIANESVGNSGEYYHNDKYIELILNNAWQDEPLGWGVVVYSIIVPIICLCGIVGNTIILLVLRGRSLKESTYTYLTVLAAADLSSCILLLFSGLARGIFWRQDGWVEYDLFVYMPLGSISSNITVSAAIGVTIDRLVIVVGPVRCRQPSFCTKNVARKLMSICILVVVVLNMPYFFIYTYDDEGNVITRKHSDNIMFTVLNWIQLVLYGLIPALFLLICNGIMIFAVKRILKQRELLLLKCRKPRVGKYLQDQTRLTITLVGIVFLFLIGEVPTYLASRRSAVSILYNGDPQKVDESVMQIFRLVATVFSAISNSANFIMYCLLNPKFLTNLKALFTRDDEEMNVSMRISTIRSPQQSETTPSHVSSSRDYPWKF